MRLALPTKTTALKWTLGVVGTILLGALGSGVWQSILGPVIHLSTRWVLNLASFGLKSYKNGIYQQIAADNQSAISFNAYLLVLSMHTVMFGALVIWAFNTVAAGVRRSARLLESLSGQPPKPKMSLESLKNELVTLVKSGRRLRVSLYVWAVLLAVTIVNQHVALARLSYVNLADAHYHQVIRLAAPYLDPHEQAQIESDFAQIGNREDYVRLLSRLEDQCKAHGRNVPKFDPW